MALALDMPWPTEDVWEERPRPARRCDCSLAPRAARAGAGAARADGELRRALDAPELLGAPGPAPARASRWPRARVLRSRSCGSAQDDGWLHCRSCSSKLASYQAALSHLQGKKHKGRMRWKTDEDALAGKIGGGSVSGVSSVRARAVCAGVGRRAASRGVGARAPTAPFASCRADAERLLGTARCLVRSDNRLGRSEMFVARRDARRRAVTSSRDRLGLLSLSPRRSRRTRRRVSRARTLVRNSRA